MTGGADGSRYSRAAREDIERNHGLRVRLNFKTTAQRWQAARGDPPGRRDDPHGPTPRCGPVSPNARATGDNGARDVDLSVKCDWRLSRRRGQRDAIGSLAGEERGPGERVVRQRELLVLVVPGSVSVPGAGLLERFRAGDLDAGGEKAVAPQRALVERHRGARCGMVGI